MFIPEYKGNQTKKIPVLSVEYFLLKFWLGGSQKPTKQQRPLLLVTYKNLMVRPYVSLKANQANTDFETCSLLGSFYRTRRCFVD